MRPESVSNYSLTVPLHRQVDMTPTSVNFLVFLTETPDIWSERRALAHNFRGCCPQWEQRRGGIIQEVCGRDGHVVSCLGQEAKRTNPEVRVKYDLQSIPPATCFYPNRARVPKGLWPLTQHHQPGDQELSIRVYRGDAVNEAIRLLLLLWPGLLCCTPALGSALLFTLSSAWLKIDPCYSPM